MNVYEKFEALENNGYTYRRRESEEWDYAFEGPDNNSLYLSKDLDTLIIALYNIMKGKEVNPSA